MNDPRHYIAIDLGAESGRVMLGRLATGSVQLEEVHRFRNGPVLFHGTWRWDVVRLWEEIQEGLRKVAAKGADVRSVSVDSWGVDYVLMRDGEPMLRAPFCYRDPRTERPFARLRDAHSAEIYAETGAQFMPMNTLYQLVAEHETDAGLFGMADRFLMIGDWFHFLLSGQVAQEESNASTTQLWNPRLRAWSGKVAGLAGLPPRVLPPVVAPCTRLGTLLPAMQEATGLGAIEVVAGCVHDTAAGVAAVPAEGDGWAFLSSGTWSLLGVELPAPLITEESLAANFTNETGVDGTSRFLRNASGLWILQECRRAWARAGHNFEYPELLRLAAEAEPFRTLLDPTDSAFLRPGDMPGAVRQYSRETGQPTPESPGQFVRCTLESLALLYAKLLDQMDALTARRLRVLHIVGGGSRNTLLNQMTADATGRTVIAGPVEATAAGNVLLQALALGDIASHAELRRIVRASFPVETVIPGKMDEWAPAKARFEALRRE